jgi:hypothetical protein
VIRNEVEMGKEIIGRASAGRAELRRLLPGSLFRNIEHER